MSSITIRRAEPQDAARLHAALQNLSNALSDVHRASVEDLVAHGFGEQAAFFALVADDASAVDTGAQDRHQPFHGVLLASPVFSTSRGGAGLYVSDLWVADTARGTGLGHRLLQSALTLAPSSWRIVFLKLAVHNHNTDARRFYDRLGFTGLPEESVLALSGEALESLRKPS